MEIALRREAPHNVRRMDTPDPPTQTVADASARVAVVVMARVSQDLTSLFSSIDRQVYEPAAVFVVSPERPKANVALPSARWAQSFPDVAIAMQGEADYLWIVDPEAQPRPDALKALVETAERVEASVVGSKLLNRQNEEELVSVGGSTDVFGFPYSGIEDGEVDQEQYDVIRDVAYVEPASMLVRRDLAAGLGGIDTRLPYLASGLDLCQRARLAGGRVVVAPTAEVLYGSGTETTRALTWREQAGRVRAMLIAYSPVTLLWSVPGAFFIGLLLSLYRTFNGAPLALLDWVRSWVWNGIHLVTTFNARRRARSSRQAGDEELFRYQVKGSVEMRAVMSAVGALLQGEIDEDDDELVGLLDVSPGFWQQPAFLAAAFGAVFVAAFTRAIWSEGMPSVGFTLPLGESGWDTLRSYAGGWHLGGLGSPEPMHPAVGATAAVQWFFGSRAALAASAMTIGAVALGAAGMTRFIRRLGHGHASRYLSGIVFVAGVPMAAMTGTGYWPALLSVAGLPWVLAAVVQEWPSDRRPLIGRIARTALALGWSASMVPLLIVVPGLFALAWAGATRSLRPLLRALVPTGLAIPLLLPWLVSQTPASLIGAGVPFHLDPAWWAMIPIGLAAAFVVVAGKGAPARIAVTGSFIGALGFLAARAADLGAGRELTAAGGVVTSLGAAMVVAGALDVMGPLDSAGVIRRTAGRVGVAGGLATVLLVLLAIPSGRAGLPEDQFESLAFAESRAGEHGTDRLLLVGSSDVLPGEFRRMEDGTAYRLISGSPRFVEAWLPDARAGDDALAGTLEALAVGSELRPGEALAAFGVQWVVFTGDTRLEQVMASQLDLRPLPQLVYPVFESEVEAYRAIADDGVPWSWDGTSYSGRTVTGVVRLAENADSRWGPEWEQVDWANQVTTAEGVASFSGVPLFRTLARLAGFLAVALLALALWGRPPRSEVKV